MKFVDEAKIFIKAGDGGRGCVSFRREKYIPRGGPNGGDGGKGGDVIFIATNRLHSLLDFKFHQHFKAKKGEHGKGSDKHGKNGADCLVYVPVGTILKELQTREILADLTTDGERFVVARGGIGGLGNARFASSTRQAPRYAQPGQPGEEKQILLDLKLLADVGLIGAPNAGKSTLLSKLTSAKPKIADYPFTTLIPNLGVVESEDYHPFVVADIPGLIEGAHAGLGLGMRFLRHIERTKLLVHVIDASLGPEETIKNWQKINTELSAYGPALAEKTQVVTLNKIDLIMEDDKLKAVKAAFLEKGCPVYFISAAIGKGVEELKEALARRLQQDEYERKD
ncbi:MAG: GTPase ObgE [Thermodesulfobacteriota bacterium]|nr:GTPase ObgE [Thermodesulfobacteriota bacterium]